jgi:hypothetical protein
MNSKAVAMTKTEPFLETCEPVPYIGLSATVPMNRVSDAASGFSRIYAWLAMNEITPTGVSFFRYLEFLKNGLIEMQIGVPAVVQNAKAAGFVEDILPGGKYLSILHSGDYSGLQTSTYYLMTWAGEHRLMFDSQEQNQVSFWKSRLEWYLVSPAREPDPSARMTKISILLS